ncbi:hypothetical protein GE21DRAFT_1288293 [Neurospora crassa]|nr:hypothetical protein GE21DRAFT_1288293 [Neurospora crassa]
MHHRAMSDIPTYQQCVTRYRDHIGVHIALDFWTPEENQQPITGFRGFALTDDAMSLTVPAELSAPFISSSESSENPEKEVSWKIPNVHFRQVLTQGLTNMEFCYCCFFVLVIQMAIIPTLYGQSILRRAVGQNRLGIDPFELKEKVERDDNTANMEKPHNGRVIGHVLQFGRNSSGRNDVWNVKNKESRGIRGARPFWQVGGTQTSRTRSKLRGTYVLQFVQQSGNLSSSWF